MASCYFHGSLSTIELLLVAGAGVNIQDKVRKLITANVFNFSTLFYTNCKFGKGMHHSRLLFLIIVFTFFELGTKQY